MLWTVVHQGPLFMGFPRQEYLSGLPFPTPGDLPDPGIKFESLESPALAGRFFFLPLCPQKSPKLLSLAVSPKYNLKDGK